MINTMCDVDADGNILDSITYIPIPDERVITVGEGESSKCFDIETVLKLARNPFTREPWPAYVDEQVNDYLRLTTFNWEFKLLSDRMVRTVPVKLIDTLGDALLKTANILDPMRPERVIIYYGIVQLKDGKRVRVVNLDLNQTLRALNIDLTKPYHHVLYLHSRYPQDGYRAWWPYAVEHELEWLMDLIPEEFQEWYEDEDPDEESYLALRDEIVGYSENPDEVLDNFRILAQIASDAYITASQAVELDGLLHTLCPNAFLHLIYARVVDKWNLPGTYLGDEYRRVRGLRPDYRPHINVDTAIANCLNQDAL